MGFGTVRGSTSRGGVAALRELMRTGETMNLTITPDGPRGPRRKLAAGCIYASSRLGIPLVPIGLGYDRPWRSRRAWDQFAVPRPYSRARAIAGPKVQIPADLERDWCRTLSAASRTHAERVHRAGRTVGRIGRTHGGAAARRAARCRPPQGLVTVAPLAGRSATRAVHGLTHAVTRRCGSIPLAANRLSSGKRS